METSYIINVDGDNGSREKYCMVLNVGTLILIEWARKHSERVTLKQNLKKKKEVWEDRKKKQQE